MLHRTQNTPGLLSVEVADHGGWLLKNGVVVTFYHHSNDDTEFWQEVCRRWNAEEAKGYTDGF